MFSENIQLIVFLVPDAFCTRCSVRRHSSRTTTAPDPELHPASLQIRQSRRQRSPAHRSHQTESARHRHRQGVVRVVPGHEAPVHVQTSGRVRQIPSNGLPILASSRRKESSSLHFFRDGNDGVHHAPVSKGERLEREQVRADTVGRDQGSEPSQLRHQVFGSVLRKPSQDDPAGQGGEHQLPDRQLSRVEGRNGPGDEENYAALPT